MFSNIRALLAVLKAGPEGFVMRRGTLLRYIGRACDAAVPQRVTEIGDEAFDSCTELRSVTLPEGVTHIGRSAFGHCPILDSVTLPQSLRCVGAEAFRNCIALTSAELPAGVTELGERAFQNCRRLVSVTLPEGLTRVSRDMFRNCAGLRSVTLPDSVISIEADAFNGCAQLRELRLPAGLRSIGERAFSSCGLKQLHIPEGVTEIASLAFSGCLDLRLVTLPDSLGTIGSWAFHRGSCEIRIRRWIPSLEYALLESGDVRIRTEDPVTALPEQFRLAALRGFAAEEEPDFGSARDRLYCRYARWNARELVYTAFTHPELLRLLCTRDLIPPGTVDDYLNVAETRGSTEQKGLLLGSIGRIGPERITRAREARWEVEDRSGWERRERLAVLETNGDIAGRHFLLLGEDLSDTDKAELRQWLRKYRAVIDTQLTRHTDYLVNYGTPDAPEVKLAMRGGTLLLGPDDFRELIGWHFRDRPGEDFTAPSWLREIHDRAFMSLDMRSVTIPAGVREIGSDAFRCCGELVRVEIPEGVTSIGSGAVLSCRELTEITLPESLRELGTEAFRSCVGLRRLSIPAGVTKLRARTFHGCSELRTVELPDGLTSIGRRAFAYCYKLSELRLPASVTEIGDEAFGSCLGLILCAPAGCFAETWAKKHGIRFLPLP